MPADVREEAVLTRLAMRHDLSRDAVKTVLDALRRGSGMAQFSHPDFGGMAQWSPGMSMVGDMFNTEMKAKLDGVATDLAAYLSEAPSVGKGDERVDRSVSQSSAPHQWWPSDFGAPATSGSQNAMRYAVFPAKRRLVIDDHGAVHIYDTGDHRIHGVAQAQSTAATLTFSSQDGPVDLSELREVHSPSS